MDDGPPDPGGSASLRIALLLSASHFEDFYGAGLGLSRARYLAGYRNDWSWDWCQMLARKGAEPTIYVPTSGLGERAVTPDGFRVRFLALGPIAVPWLRFPALWRSPVGRYAGQVVNAVAFLPALRAGLKADGIDVLCVQEYWTARFDVLTRALGQGTPVVAVDQGLPDRREIKVLKRGSFQRCAAAIVQTRHEGDKVARYGGRAQRIPNAVDARVFSPPPEGKRRDKPVVLFVGRLHDAQKRISDVVRALALLPGDWRLEIAGSGPDRPALEALAAELGVQDRVSYLGFVSDSLRLRDLYRGASVLALPSKYEGLPMVLLEAMSCATPVVGSDIPAIAEVVEPGRSGLLVPVGEPPHLAAALQDAVAQGAKLGRRAREAILESYDQAVVGSQLVDLLRGAARAPRPRAA
ncbi:MAG: glycosyltransferase family 4 protein [Solirubrobacteraceae bacterium]